ncbi:hypothetical protein AB9K41_05600, partial [Cribrihabitans sp. XS_ASV171]
KVDVYQDYLEGKEWAHYEAEADPQGVDGRLNISAKLPPSATIPAAGEKPQVTEVAPKLMDDGSVRLKIEGRRLIYGEASENSTSFGNRIEDTRLKIRIGSYIQYVYGSEFKEVDIDASTGSGSFSVQLPNDILVSRAHFSFERPSPGGTSNEKGEWAAATEAEPSEEF